MITNVEISNAIKACEELGQARVSDVLYFVLCRIFEDKNVPYKALFGDFSNFEEYETIPYVAKLKKEVDLIFPFSTEDDISFEENKAYMLKLKRDTEAAMKNNEIAKKDALRILSDISVKLNDKFSVQEAVKDQMVVVEQKYNSVCPYCNHEVSAMPLSKENAMKMYNLKEK